MSKELRKTGLEVVGDVPWGTHCCQFYQTPQDLLDILVPYFTEGLKNNEFCMWVTSEPLGVEAARRAMAAAVPDFENCVRRGQIEIIPHTEWYLKGGTFDSERVLGGWVNKLEGALASGYEGLRLTGNTFWLEQKDWRAFTEYEAAVDSVIGRYRLLAICTYSLDHCGFNEILDVIGNHRFALVRREGRWELVESAERRRAYNELTRLAQFPEQNPNPVFRVTTGGDVMFANAPARAVLEAMGWRKDTPIPQSLRTLAGEAESGSGVVEAEITDGRGRTHWLAAVRPAGESYINLYARDISERKQAEETLRENERQLRQAHELLEAVTLGTKVMIATVDRDCRYTSFNQEHQNELRRLTGKDTAIGMSLMEALAGMPEEQERALSLWSRALNGETVVQTMAFGDPGRYRRWYSTRHTPIRDASGAVVGAGEVTSDITEQMQVQQALRESEERFRKVFENAATGIAIKDWEGRFQQCNPAYCALLGYTQEELRRINFASLIHPEDLDANLAEIHRLQAGELPFFKIENRYVRKDGQPVWVNKFVSVLSLAPGSPANLVALVTDITDRKRAQEEMEMHRLLLDTVVNCMPVAVSLIRGSDLKLQMINPAFQAFAPGKDMLGQTLDQLWPETGQDFGALCSRVLETGEPYRVEDGLFIVRRRPGGPVEPAYFSGSLHRVRVPGEEGWGILITAWETTERKQTEVALCESAERLKRAQEIARLGSWELDLVNNQLTWSDEVYRIFGLNPGEFGATYEAFLAAVHPEDRAAVDSAYSGSIRDGRDSYEIEHRIVRRNTGEIRIVHEKCEHRRDTSGRVVRSIGMVHDVTERRKTEELRHALDEQERLRLGAAVEQASDSVVIVDLDGTIRYVNAAFESINRIPREKAVGRSYFGFLAGDPAAKDIRESAAQGIAWHGPLTRSIPEGRPVELEVTISPAIEPSGKVIGGLITEKDVTQENALQRQIRQTQKMEALGTLAGGITHDFNNILSAIIINTELALLDLDTSNPARRPLPTVLQAANRGKELVKQIITFSRQREWDRKPLEVAPVIKEAMRFLRSTLSKDVVIDETIAHDCGVVLGDPSQIHQIIVNLCQNAAQAMRDRGGDLEVKLEPVDVDKAMVARHPDLKVGPYVRLMVADRGCGMTNELMERIFEPFFTTREPGGGSGLGLAVVHGIVKSYNGAITVYSEPGKGSVFSVYLPRLEKETLASVAAKPLRAQKGNERILLVEDEEAQLKSTARLLERLGYCVTGKPSGRTALTAFKRNPAAFDLVITDQAMPRMSGLELASALAKVRSDIPIILCTGFSEKIKGDITGRDGIREFVMKPFSLQEISRIIRRALTKKDNAR